MRDRAIPAGRKGTHHGEREAEEENDNRTKGGEKERALRRDRDEEEIETGEARESRSQGSDKNIARVAKTEAHGDSRCRERGSLGSRR
jgi:hypothetical protein